MGAGAHIYNKDRTNFTETLRGKESRNDNHLDLFLNYLLGRGKNDDPPGYQLAWRGLTGTRRQQIARRELGKAFRTGGRQEDFMSLEEFFFGKKFSVKDFLQVSAQHTIKLFETSAKVLETVILRERSDRRIS